MKTLLSVLAGMLITISVLAQVPQKMSYQAVVRDAVDEIIIDTEVGMQISILQGTIDGTAVYVETQTPTSNTNGLVSIEIGGGVIVSGDFSTIDWANDIYFIKTETDPTGGTAYTITGTSQLMSVPYALHAKTAETIIGGITEIDPTFTGSEANNITSTDITNLSNLSNTNTGDQDLSLLATQTALKDTATAIRADFPDVSGFVSTEADPIFTAWDKTTGVNITESQITDLTHFTNANETDPVYTAWNKDYVSLINQPTTITTAQATEITNNTAKNTYPTADATKLAEIEAGAEINVNADWNATTGDAEILNKPDLNVYLDNTDAQNLTLNGTTLEISGGTNTDLSSLQDGIGTDDQNIANLGLVNTTLTVGIENGTSQSVDLAGLQDGYEANTDNQQISRTGLTVTLTNGGTYQDSINTYTAGTGIDITNNVISASDICGLSIGDTYQGGIIFYLDASGCHGLISAHTDQSTGLTEWYNGSYTVTNAVRDGLGAGVHNTERIIAHQGTGSYAAQICANYQGGNYGDWYLPSKYELNLMNENIGHGNGDIGGFQSYYWSSTETDSGHAWLLLFPGGIYYNYGKDARSGVRAVRAF